MRRDRKFLSLSLALLLALRTFVPVGYMLQLPAADGGPGFGLILCPTQNAGLDLSLLASIDPGARHGHHATHAHGVPGTAGDNVVEIGSDCSAWLTSASLAFESSAAFSPPRLPARDGLIVRTRHVPAERPRNDAPARAPPRIS